MRCFSSLKKLTCNVLWEWGKPGLLLKRSRWWIPAGSEQRKKVQRVDGSNPCEFFLNPSLVRAVNTKVNKVSKKVSSLLRRTLTCVVPCPASSCRQGNEAKTNHRYTNMSAYFCSKGNFNPAQLTQDAKNSET